MLCNIFLYNLIYLISTSKPSLPKNVQYCIQEVSYVIICIQQIIQKIWLKFCYLMDSKLIQDHNSVYIQGLSVQLLLSSLYIIVQYLKMQVMIQLLYLLQQQYLQISCQSNIYIYYNNFNISLLYGYQQILMVQKVKNRTQQKSQYNINYYEYVSTTNINMAKLVHNLIVTKKSNKAQFACSDYFVRSKYSFIQIALHTKCLY
eukprot:TRINITY_DN1900_c0_g1_i15.p2 TRINITY_DN1900_c0_g1~~TRINITY_DN1900_c0_g1_i15.p2  ORF type:complete len:203 (+),score=-34.96 TRINITY_DN1900_c0_g1_i15:1857-2465(+)